MTVKLAFIWHMHQPSYGNPRGESPSLPWVRLHSSRGYFDMAWILERHPKISASFNLTPVLTEQIADYVGGVRDKYWHLSRKPARQLTAKERAFIVKRFFACCLETCIQTRPRYAHLHRRVRPG